VGVVPDTITIQHIPACPNTGVAYERVAEALRRLGSPSVAVTMQEIPAHADAEREGFRGSPTVLIDGTDPFAEPATPAAFACRVYATAAGTDVAPTVRQLLDAIAAPHGN